jgi:hypothetical protein
MTFCVKEKKGISGDESIKQLNLSLNLSTRKNNSWFHSPHLNFLTQPYLAQEYKKKSQK